MGQVVQTDRLSAVTVEMEAPPPGITLSRILVWNPATDSRDLYLEDEQGRRYERASEVIWRPHDEQTSEVPGEPVRTTPEVRQKLSFEPVQPLARHLALHVRVVELFVADRIAFDVTVPDGVELRLDTEPPWPASKLVLPRPPGAVRKNGCWLGILRIQVQLGKIPRALDKALAGGLQELGCWSSSRGRGVRAAVSTWSG